MYKCCLIEVIEKMFIILCFTAQSRIYKALLTQEIKIHVRRDLYYGHIKI